MKFLPIAGVNARQVTNWWFLSSLMITFLAACAPGAGNGDSIGEPSGDGVVVTVQSPALQPVMPSPAGPGDQAYPYPESGDIQGLPTGYPGEMLPGPPGNIDGRQPGGYPGGPDGPTTAGDPLLPSTPSAELASLITAIVRDLSRQTDTPTDEIAYLSAEPMTWPDMGLGCPNPELFYAEVITEGYLIRMAIGERLFDYHTDSGSNFVLCRDGQPIATDSLP